MLVARTHAECLIVMPTGSGKTLLYVIPTLLAGAQVTVVIVPLIALRQDLIRRCAEWQIPLTVYDHRRHTAHHLHAVTSLFLVDIDDSVSDGSRAVLSALHHHHRLDRLVFEEAHLILMAGYYWEKIALLVTLRDLGCPVVCLTTTLPPSGEFYLKEQLHRSSLGARLAETLGAHFYHAGLSSEARNRMW